MAITVRQEQVNRMRSLIKEMERESEAYYLHDDPIVPDNVYDDQYEQLVHLEAQTGIVLAGSPTAKVSGGVVDSLAKVTHPKPMLSAAKTKSVKELLDFAKNGPEEGLMSVSWKEDGLTLVLTYENGVLTQAATRGDGIVGEDVTHNAKCISNIPLVLPQPILPKVVVRGECVVSWADFKAINEALEEPYSHPRNLAAGSIRKLDSDEAAKRHLAFKAFEVVEPEAKTKHHQWERLEFLGFDVAEYVITPISGLKTAISSFTPNHYDYPVDGLIVEYDDQEFGRSLGATGHHERSKMALKWADESYPTIFRGVRLQTTRTGMVSLTAEFDPVAINGAMVSRATLHNVTFFNALRLGVGDRIEVAKQNMIIPAIVKNTTRSGTYKLPTTCPCCSATLKLVKPNETEFLQCPNKACPSKLVNQFAHFVSKHGMNVVGLSNSILQQLLDGGFLFQFSDIYNLKYNADLIADMDGMGKRSTEKLLSAIETSRYTTLCQLVTAFGIPLVGKTAGMTIESFFAGDAERFVKALDEGFDFHELSDFGDAMCNSLADWWKDNRTQFLAVLNSVTVGRAKTKTGNCSLSGKTIVITGTLSLPRADIEGLLESYGIVVGNSVTKRTDYVLVGDKPGGTKMNKAASLGIPLLSEADVMRELK